MQKVRFCFCILEDLPLLLDQKARFWVWVCQSQQSSTWAERGELLNTPAVSSGIAKCCFSGLNTGVCVMTAKLGLIHCSCRCHKTRSAGHSKGKEMGWDGLCLVLGEVHLSVHKGLRT